MSTDYDLPAYLRPPLSLSLDWLVFRAVCTFDFDRHNDNLGRQVMACFNAENAVTADYLYGLMPPIFDAVEMQMEIIMPNWGEHLTQDEAETVIHNGLIFAARVLQRYARPNMWQTQRA